MQYILSNLNSTSDPAVAIKDYIKMAFTISPLDIAFDDLPTIERDVMNYNESDREQRIHTIWATFFDRLSKTMGIPIDLTKIDDQGPKLLIELTVSNRPLTIKL